MSHVAPPLTRSPETLPSAWYRDPEVAEHERQAIFARNWMLFAHAAQLRHPGDTVAGEVAGRPVFAIRGRDGGLRAFHNVCRHRAAVLVDPGPGRIGVLRCRYHGWVYDHEGRLKKAPDFGEAPDFDPSCYGLFPVRAAEWKGLVFLCLDSDAPDLLAWLGPIAEMAKDYPLERLTYHRDRLKEVAVDWKTYGENYLEGYHLTHMHPGLCAAMDVSQYLIAPYDRDGFFHLYAPKKEDGLTEGLYFYKFPTLMLNLYEWGASIASNQPDGPGRMTMTNWYFVRDPAAVEANDAAIAWSQQIVDEDLAVVTGVQRNLAAGVYDRGRLSPKHEHAVAVFQDMVRRALGEA